MNKTALLMLIVISAAAVALVPAVSQPAESDMGEQSTLDLDSCTAEFSGTSYTITSIGTIGTDVRTPDLIIPAAFTNPEDGQEYPVTEIAPNAFEGKGIESIQFGDANGASRITYIGGYAFSENSLANGLSVYDPDLNGGTGGLTGDSLPSSVNSVGTYLFRNTGLTSFKLSSASSLTVLGYSMFDSCRDLRTVDLGSADGLISLGTNSFNRCSGLTSIGQGPDAVILPSGLVDIGEETFFGCSGLTAADLSGLGNLNPAAGIRDYCFSDCTALASVTLPDNLQTIGGGAFYDCSRLNYIKIPSDVTSIGRDAFDSDTANGVIDLTAIPSGRAGTIPNAPWTTDDNTKIILWASQPATDLETYPFVFNTETEKIVGMQPYRLSPDGTRTETLTTAADIASSEYWVDNALTVPASFTVGGTEYPVSGLSDGAFATSPYTTLLKSVTFLNNPSLTSIPYGSFMRCTELTSVTLPDTVTGIGDYAFMYCSKLTSVDTENLTSIGSWAFSDCDVADMNIPNVAAVGAYAFYGSEVSDVTLSDNLTSIPAYAFAGCENLSRITIPESVRRIDSHAFSNSGLTDVTISDGVTRICMYAFESCGLVEIVIPNSVTDIETYAFNNCTNLKTITFEGNGIAAIGTNAFRNCNILSAINIPGELEGSVSGAPWGGTGAAVNWASDVNDNDTADALERYTILFNANGGTGAPESVTMGPSVTPYILPGASDLAGMTYEGHAFLGWTMASAQGTLVTEIRPGITTGFAEGTPMPAPTVVMTGTYTLYAVWDSIGGIPGEPTLPGPPDSGDDDPDPSVPEEEENPSDENRPGGRDNSLMWQIAALAAILIILALVLLWLNQIRP